MYITCHVRKRDNITLQKQNLQLKKQVGLFVTHYIINQNKEEVCCQIEIYFLLICKFIEVVILNVWQNVNGVHMCFVDV